MRARLNPVLALCLVACALVLVHSQYRSRRLFVELERAQAQTRQLEVEARQLQLEQSKLSQHARIESVAKRSNMLGVKPSDTVYLTPPEAK